MAEVYCLLLASVVILITIIEVAGTNHNNKGENDVHASRKNAYVSSEIYTTSWAVEITEGGQVMADKIADKYGFKNLGRIPVNIHLFHSTFGIIFNVIRLVIKIASIIFQMNENEREHFQNNSPFISKTNNLLTEPCVSRKKTFYFTTRSSLT